MPDLRELALARANQIRSERAALKARLHRRELMLDDVLTNVPPCARSAKVIDVIAAAPYFGPVKAKNAMKLLREPEHRRLGDMTRQRRRELLELLAKRNPKALYGAAWREYVC